VPKVCHWKLYIAGSKGDGHASCAMSVPLPFPPTHGKQGWWTCLLSCVSVSVSPLVMGMTLSFNHSPVYRKQGWWAWVFHWTSLQFTESNWLSHGTILQFTKSNSDGPDSFTESFSSLHCKKSWRSSSTPASGDAGPKHTGVKQSFRHPWRKFYYKYLTFSTFFTSVELVRQSRKVSKAACGARTYDLQDYSLPLYHCATLSYQLLSQ
jgi:hypothetical protein